LKISGSLTTFLKKETATVTGSARSLAKKKSKKLPGYLFHKPTGQARARINGKDFYLGPYGSESSRRKYGDLIAKHTSGQLLDPVLGGSRTTSEVVEDRGIAVSELLLAFKKHAEAYYVKDGKRTAEVDCFYSAMRPVRELYSVFPAKDFGPLHLRAVRDRFVANGWTRTFCNKSTNRVRHIWRWAVKVRVVVGERNSVGGNPNCRTANYSTERRFNRFPVF
jgi:hypothetical protein